MKDPARYAGKPLLRLLECYVLHAAGALRKADEERLTLMAPKLREVYKATGSWDEIIASVMQFPPTMPELVKASWARNSDLARRNQEHLEPEDFAEMFVEANFVPDD